MSASLPDGAKVELAIGHREDRRCWCRASLRYGFHLGRHWRIPRHVALTVYGLPRPCAVQEMVSHELPAIRREPEGVYRVCVINVECKNLTPRFRAP